MDKAPQNPHQEVQNALLTLIFITIITIIFITIVFITSSTTS